MPVNICRINPQGEKNEKIAWLCEGNWRLPDQAKAFEAWLLENHTKLQPGQYVADIGFEPRKGALGGGAAFHPKIMQMMVNIGMSLYLSEYPSDDED